MMRLTQIAKIFNQPFQKVTKDLLIRGKGRYFLIADHEVYAFQSTKEVIIPYSVVSRYGKLVHQKKIEKPVRLKDLVDPRSNNSSNRSYSSAVLLGHFNHGKTTLLDTLINVTDSQQNSDLVSEEKHGITQEVRTKSINLSRSLSLTLIDTPGQDIFYRMRTHGAEVADFGLLLLSMTDGICSQTEESIGILETLNIPVIVCLNKLDLIPEGQRQEKIKYFIEQCKAYVALSSATFIPISAKKTIHIDNLLESMHLLSQLVLSEESNALLSRSFHQTNRNPYYLGKGYVLNIIHDDYSSKTLHLLMTAGNMTIGDYFVAGGWSGRVKSIITTNDHQLLSSSTALAGSPGEVESASLIHRGMAVKITAVFHEQIRNPRPLGEFIYFFSLRGKEHSSKLEKKSNSIIQEQCELFMDQNVMEEELAKYRLEEEEIESLQLRHLLQHTKSLSKFYQSQFSHQQSKHSHQQQPSESLLPFISDIETEMLLRVPFEKESKLSPSDATLQFPDYRPRNVLVKASSDIEISTIRDIYDEETEDFFAVINQTFPPSSNNAAADTVQETPKKRLTDVLEKWKDKKYPRSLIYTGVGQVTVFDFEVAKLANAVILCYNVDVEKFALKEIKNHGIECKSYDKAQDVIDYLLQRTSPP